MKVTSVNTQTPSFMPTTADRTAVPAEKREETAAQTAVINAKAPEKADESKQDQERAKAVERINESLKMLNTQLEFEMSKSDARVIIRVKDSSTGEVIREIPPEELRAALEGLSEGLGVIVDRKV